MASSNEIREANGVKVTQRMVRGIDITVANCKNGEDNFIMNQEVKKVNGLTSVAISIVESNAQVYRILKDEDDNIKTYHKSSLMDQFIETPLKVSFDKSRIFIGATNMGYNVWIDENGICTYTSSHKLGW